MPDIEKTWVDFQDICLIELFPPLTMILVRPSNFIEINTLSTMPVKNMLNKGQFFEGQFLGASGFPLALNTFDFDEGSGLLDGITHSTKMIRHHPLGICMFDEHGLPYIDYTEEIQKKSNVEHNGMSGGVIHNMSGNGKALWAGMNISGNNKITRFIPAYKMIHAIKNYKHAKSIVLDYIDEQRKNEDLDRYLMDAVRVYREYFDSFIK